MAEACPFGGHSLSWPPVATRATVNEVCKKCAKGLLGGTVHQITDWKTLLSKWEFLGHDVLPGGR